MKNKIKSSIGIYIIKRVFYFLPTLFIITIFSFGLSKLASGDPVTDNQRNATVSDITYLQNAKRLNLHLPAFYCSFAPQSSPDTLYKIIKKLERESQERLLAQYGNWSEISSYYHEISRLEEVLLALPDSIAPNLVIKVKADLVNLFTRYKSDRIKLILNRIETNLEKSPLLQSTFGKDFQSLKTKFAIVEQNATPIKNWLPDFKWYGFQNQYHLWVSGLFRGDFGKSYNDYRPVGDIIRPALSWTLSMFFVTIFIVLLISIPMGVFAASHRNSRFDKITSFVSFMLYSLPSFWVGTALLMFFTTPEYGMNWFDGIWQSSLSKDAPFFDRFWETSNHLVLPIICMVYPSFAFISRQIRGSMVEVLDQQYILTARAKGLGNRAIYWKHAFRNALFPIITILGGIFPVAITGSVVLEFIYQIPGMGWITLEAIRDQNWPVVFAILMMSAILTLVGILVADILYAIADPRVSYEKR